MYVYNVYMCLNIVLFHVIMHIYVVHARSTEISSLFISNLKVILLT